MLLSARHTFRSHLCISPYSNQEFQCAVISPIVLFCVAMYSPYVHSSTTQPGFDSNMDGVIHGSNTSLPSA
jgi:hypothetical protein